MFIIVKYLSALLGAIFWFILMPSYTSGTILLLCLIITVVIIVDERRSNARAAQKRPVNSANKEQNPTNRG